MTWLLSGLVICVIAQTVLLAPLGLGGLRPDLFLLLVILLSQRASPELTTTLGFVVGLYQDALSGAPLGLRAFTYSLMGFLAARLSHHLYTDTTLAQFWLLLAGSAASGCISLALFSFFLGPPPLFPALLWVITPEALSTAAFGLLVLRLPRFLTTLSRSA